MIAGRSSTPTPSSQSPVATGSARRVRSSTKRRPESVPTMRGTSAGSPTPSERSAAFSSHLAAHEKVRQRFSGRIALIDLANDYYASRSTPDAGPWSTAERGWGYTLGVEGKGVEVLER